MIRFKPLVIGAMRLGPWGAQFSTTELERFIDECLELDLTDFDHADIYGHYKQEALFGEVLKRRPDLKQQVEITTKFGIQMLSDNRPRHTIKSYNTSKAYIISSVEQSLQNFGVEKIKLVLIHRPDILMNPDEVAESIEHLKKQGKVDYFGVSNFTPSQFELLNSRTTLATNQIEASITHLNPFFDGTFDQCMNYGIPPMAWSPFGGGQIFHEQNEQLNRIRTVSSELGEKYKASLDQILIAFLTKHPAGIIPVIGSSNTDRIKSALQGTKIQLSSEDWYKFLEASRGREVD